MKAQKGVKLASNVFILVKILSTFVFLSFVALVMMLIGFPWYLPTFIFSFALLLLVLQIRNTRKALSEAKNPDPEPDTFSGREISEEKGSFKGQEGFGLLAVVAIIAVIGFALAGGYLLTQKAPKTEKQNNENQTTSTAVSEKDTQEPAVKKNTKQAASRQALDCEKDFDCFIEAQKNGKDAKVKFVSLRNPFMATLMQTKFYKNKNEYIYHQTMIPNEYSVKDYIKDFKAKASPKEVAKLETMSDSQIEAQLASMKKWSEQAMGAQKDTERSCVYDKPSNLIAFLKKWETGSFSNKDWDFATLCVNRNLLENPDCTLQPASSGPNEKPSSLRVSEISVNRRAVSAFSFGVSGFSGGESEVAWRIENKNIARLSAFNGKDVKIIPTGVGKTNLVVTDTSVKDCQITVPVTVTGN